MTRRFTLFEPTIVPIRIRPDLVVYVSGIPWDLSEKEGARLAKVMTSYAAVPQQKLLSPPNQSDHIGGR